MKHRDLTLLAGSLGLLAALARPAVAAPALPLVFIGRHTVAPADFRQPAGTPAAAPAPDLGRGIVVARFDPATGALTNATLAAGLEQPTWLVVDRDRPVLFSTSELGNKGDVHGRVASFAIDRATGALHPIDDVDAGGGGATHLAFASQLSTLFVADYAGGEVGAIPVAPDGRLSPVASLVTDTGSGPSPRQKGPHAHSVTVAPGGRFLLVPDLGADRVFVYRINARTHALSPAAVPFATLPPGSGPRHAVFSRDGHEVFLVTEMGAAIFRFGWNAATGALTETQRMALDAPGFAGRRSASEIALSRDGRFLYVGNRGENALQVYAVGASGSPLRLVQRIDCGGSVPWSFTIAPDGKWLLVANEASNAVSVFRIDPPTGVLAATGNVLHVASPVAIAFDSNSGGK